jgi:integrase
VVQVLVVRPEVVTDGHAGVGQGIDGDRLYAFFHLIAFWGLRRGEGVGQDWVHVDLAEETITIAKSITVDGWTPVEGAPKTDGSAAMIALGPLTAQVLREYRVRQTSEREQADAKWVETGKVFTTKTGEWLHPEKVSDAFRAICREADLPPINLRDLRHCAATLIHAGGGDLHAIKETLRQSTIKLASDTYTSLLAEVDQEIAAKAEGIVTQARKRAVRPEEMSVT